MSRHRMLDACMLGRSSQAVQGAHPVVCSEAALVAGVGLQRGKVQDGIAAHQPLQLGRTEQVDGRAAA